MEENNSEIEEINIDELINEHIKQKFKDITDVISFHISILDNDDLKEMPNIDYLKLFRFFESAVNNLSSKDPSIRSVIFGKLHNEIKAFYDFYNNIIKQYKDNAENAWMIFFKNTHQIKELANEVTNESDNKEEEMELYINNIKVEFIEEYNKTFREELSTLKKIINIKFFYFDKVLWSSVNNSSGIKSYLKDLSLQPPYNLKSYIEQYLKNVNFSAGNVSEWHLYLRSCMNKL